MIGIIAQKNIDNYIVSPAFLLKFA